MILDKISPTLFEDCLSDLALIHFDPSKIYSRIIRKPFKRWQGFSVFELFPNKPGFCACGCGRELKGRKTRWASTECQELPLCVCKIINGDMQTIRRAMMCYLKFECCKCGCENYCFDKNLASGIQIDHIVAVKNGGGGCWLGNYQFICHKCHAQKTAMDNSLRNKQGFMPLSLNFN